MTPEDRDEIKKFVEEYLTPLPDPLAEAIRIVHQIHRNRVSVLQGEIADLKAEISKLKMQSKNDA